MLINEAIEAYRWAESNLKPGDEQEVIKFRAFASAMLFRYTADKSYETKLIDDLERIKLPVNENIWGNGDYESLFALWTYALTDNDKVNKQYQKKIIDKVLDYTDYMYVKAAEKRACRMAFPWMQETAVGNATTPFVTPLIMAYEITQDSAYLDYVYTSCDYILGGNPLNLVWTTGLGENSVKDPLMINNWYSDNDEPIPGITVYGPIKLNMSHIRPWKGRTPNIPWHPGFSHNTCYPDKTLWPAHELFFENRLCPITNEFTIMQVSGLVGSVFGYLCAPGIPAK